MKTPVSDTFKLFTILNTAVFGQLPTLVDHKLIYKGVNQRIYWYLYFFPLKMTTILLPNLIFQSYIGYISNKLDLSIIHGPHLSPVKQFQSINILMQYATLIPSSWFKENISVSPFKEMNVPLPVKIWIPFTQDKFDWNWPFFSEFS